MVAEVGPREGLFVCLFFKMKETKECLNADGKALLKGGN